MSTFLSGGSIVGPNGVEKADVLITGNSVVAAGHDIPVPNSARTIDATGLVTMPGLVDIHAHLREPGTEEAETIATGARGAALGGFTAVIAMPSTNPTIDSPSVVRDVLALAEGAACEVLPAAALTVGRKGELLTPMGELASMGVRLFSDAGRGVQNPAIMRSIMEYATGLEAVTDGEPIVLAQHCEVTALSKHGHMHEGEWSTRLGVAGQPVVAETLMMQRDVALAELTGARIHFQHVSSAAAVEIIRDAKKAGLALTAEATTHHFTLTDAACAGYDPVFKVNPPLRTSDDVAAIREALADGTIDCIATDHSPHEPHTKEFAFDHAPAGMLGFETALSLALSELGLPIERVVDLMSSRPAEIAGIADRHGQLVEQGNRANLTVVDLDEVWTVGGTEMASRSQNTPYEGRQLKGKVKYTIVEGEVTVDQRVVTE